MAIVFDTKDDIEFYRLAAMSYALKLELRGMTRRGRSAYALAKQAYGLTGSREKVAARLEQMVEERIGKRKAERLRATLTDNGRYSLALDYNAWQDADMSSDAFEAKWSVRPEYL